MEEPKERLYCNEQILKEVTDELGLPLKTVKEMVSCQSEYVKRIMEQGAFDNIRLPYLGAFVAKVKEIQMLQYLAGMTPEQGSQFKKDVRTGKIRLNSWEQKIKQERKLKKQSNENTTGDKL